MATGIQPKVNDAKFDLIFSYTTNSYNWALARGATGLTAPSLNDTILILLKKADYYMASIAP